MNKQTTPCVATDILSILRRAQRHLLAMGSMDADTGYKDASLVRLMRDWNSLGLWGGASLAACASRIEDSEIEEL